MRIIRHLAFVIICLTAASVSWSQQPVDSVAQALLERLDDAMFPHAYQMTMSMVTHRSGQDDLDYIYDVVGVGEDRSLMTITSPAREVGKQILLNGENLWLYVPDVSRPIKLTRKSSFMGSTFSNEDVMNSTMADDYFARIMDRYILDGKPYFSAELTARNRSVAYARMTAVIDSAAAIADTIVYYGLSGKALKQLILTDRKMLAGLIRPSKMTMYDYLEEGAWTEVVILTLEAKEKLPENIFDPTRLGK